MCKAKQNHRRSTKALQEIEGERREEKNIPWLPTEEKAA
jgi:hypothetical protein